VDQRQKTPPRAWGRPLKIPAALWRPGNTPTGVGKTPQSDVCFVVRRKHPHGRGEDKRGSACEATSMETPPRAWGRQLLTLARLPGNRNTPTGVGKTPLGAWILAIRRKHPHGRGEDQSDTTEGFLIAETPPRAWGRHKWIKPSLDHIRNTPTGVGKTSTKSWRPTTRKKHPHGRGEDDRPSCPSVSKLETPPRAWGRHFGSCHAGTDSRNTPTGVGKTFAARHAGS